MRCISIPTIAVKSAGRGGLGLLLGLGLLAVLGWFLWPTSTQPDPAPQAAARPSAQFEQRTGDPAGAAGPAAARSTAESGSTTSNPAAAAAQRSGGGLRGAIRGSLEFAPGLTPRPWRLELVPSQVLLGRDRAVTRSLERSAEQLEFEFTDLPLAGYDLWARAEGATSTPQPVLLVPGAAEVQVLLQLARAGNLSGSVIDPDGLGIADLEVHVHATPAGLRRQTRSDVSGRFAFEGLPDGQYELRLGPSAAPLIAPRSLSFAAPGLELEPLRLPRLFGLEILVTDALGQPVPSARVRGFSNAGGMIDVESDSQGRARAHLLAPGRISLRTDVPGRGRGYTEVLIEADAAASPSATLVLSP